MSNTKRETAPILAKSTTIQDTLTHFNMGSLDTNITPQDPQSSTLRYLNNQMAIQSALDVQDQIEDKKEERKLEKEARRLRLQKELREMGPSGGDSDANARAKVLQNFSDPAWMAQFKDMEQEDKELMLTSMMGVANSGGKNSDGGMVPLLMMMSKQQNSGPPPMSVKEVIDLMAALQPKNNQNDTLQWVNVLKDLIKPASGTDELQKVLMGKIVEQAFQKPEKSDVSEMLKNVRDMNEFFGGGQHGASEQDVRIAALNADTSLRHAQLQLDARKMALEMEQASNRDAQMTNLIGAAASVGLPAIGSVAQKLFKSPQSEAPPQEIQQQPPPQPRPQRPQPQPQQQPPPQQNQQVAAPVQQHTPPKEPLTMVLKCDCGTQFRVNTLPDGGWPVSVICPGCSEEVDISEFTKPPEKEEN